MNPLIFFVCFFVSSMSSWDQKIWEPLFQRRQKTMDEGLCEGGEFPATTKSLYLKMRWYGKCSREWAQRDASNWWYTRAWVHSSFLSLQNFSSWLYWLLSFLMYMSFFILKRKRGQGFSSVAQCLPSKHEVLNSMSATQK